MYPDRVSEICREYDFPHVPLFYQRDEVNRAVFESLDKFGYYWDMGAGKTFGTTLHNCIWRKEMGEGVVIQLCPPILLRQWSKWLTSCGIKNVIYAGTPAQRRKIQLDRSLRYILMSVAILKIDFKYLMDKFANWKLSVTIDEATSIKNHESANFIHVYQMQQNLKAAMVPATGTPLSTPRDAYAYIKLIAPGTYRSYRSFENVHIASTDQFGRPTEWKNLHILKDALALNASFISTPEVVPDMPRARIDGIEYELSRHHSNLYKQLVDMQLLAYESGEIIDATTPQRLYHAVQQIVVNYAHFAQDNSVKPEVFSYLDEYLEELGPKTKTIIFANYQMSVRAIMEYLTLKGLRAVQINGAVSAAKIAENKDAFIEDPDLQVLVMNPQSGGVGVDGLQKVCNHMVFFEIPTIPKDFWQAVKRLERPGQKFVTDVRIMTALGTVQMHLRKQLENNDALINTVVPSVNDLRAALHGK